MVEREEQLGSSDVGIAEVAVPRGEVVVGGVVEAVAMGADVEVRLGKPLLP